jgi:hypothetical protein
MACVRSGIPGWAIGLLIRGRAGAERRAANAGKKNKATANQSPWLKRCFPKSPIPTNVYASAIGLCKDSCLIAKERCTVSRELDDSPLGSLLSTRSTRWSPRARDRGGSARMFGCRLS